MACCQVENETPADRLSGSCQVPVRFPSGCCQVGAVFSAGAKRGWLSREEALALAFLALDTAVRPGDRRIWLQVLDILDVRDEELFERTQALIPLLALSDTSVIARLAPVLIERSSDSLLVEVLLAAFSATTKKARQLVLKAALNRPRPENAEDLAAWLSLFAEDKDKSVASLAKRLISQWEIEVEALAEEEPAVYAGGKNQAGAGRYPC